MKHAQWGYGQGKRAPYRPWLKASLSRRTRKHLEHQFRRVASLLGQNFELATIAKRLKVSLDWVHKVRKAVHIKKRPKLFRNKYPISHEQAVAMLARQGGKCPMCDKPLTLAQAHVDHDHADGHVRGLTCREHNLGLGFFNDNKREMARGLKYLVVDEATHKGIRPRTIQQLATDPIVDRRLTWENAVIATRPGDESLWLEAKAGRRLNGAERRRALIHARNTGEPTSNNYHLAKIFQCHEKGVRQAKAQLLKNLSPTDPINMMVSLVESTVGLTVLFDGQPVDGLQLRELMERSAYPEPAIVPVSTPVPLPAYLPMDDVA